MLLPLHRINNAGAVVGSVWGHSRWVSGPAICGCTIHVGTSYELARGGGTGQGRGAHTPSTAAETVAALRGMSCELAMRTLSGTTCVTDESASSSVAPPTLDGDA